MLSNCNFAAIKTKIDADVRTLASGEIASTHSVMGRNDSSKIHLNLAIDIQSVYEIFYGRSQSEFSRETTVSQMTARVELLAEEISKIERNGAKPPLVQQQNRTKGDESKWNNYVLKISDMKVNTRTYFATIIFYSYQIQRLGNIKASS